MTMLPCLSLRWQALVLGMGVGLALLYVMAGHAAVDAAYHGHSIFHGVLADSADHPLRFYLRKADALAVYLLALWLAMLLTQYTIARRLGNALRAPSLGDMLLDVLVFAFCLAGFFCFLLMYGQEREWYPIARIMAFEGNPPFQHRILFVLPALALRAIFPAMPVLDAFLWSQMLAAALALWAVRRLASLFIRPDLAFVAQPLLLLMWAATLRYYTFFDIGIMFVYALALYYLLAGAQRPYLLVFAVGTLNHESTLFLVLLSAAVLCRRIQPIRLLRLLLLQLLLYCAVRAVLFALLPTHAAWESGKPAYNLFLLTHRPQELLINLGPLLLWFGLASFGLRQAPAPLRWCLLLLPCLLVMTFLVGQLHEARQFDAFIPVAAALIASILADASGALPARPLFRRGRMPVGQAAA
ncbi:MAG: hypothetical protein ABIT83_09475 [Massilia sp.]